VFWKAPQGIHGSSVPLQKRLSRKSAFAFAVYGLPGRQYFVGPRVYGFSSGDPFSESGRLYNEAVCLQPFVRNAKINLGLYIGAPRPDGFHALATVYQTLELYDWSRSQPDGHRQLRCG